MAYITSTNIPHHTGPAMIVTVGTTGPMSLDSIARAPEPTDPRFEVAPVASISGGFLANIEVTSNRKRKSVR